MSVYCFQISSKCEEFKISAADSRPARGCFHAVCFQRSTSVFSVSLSLSHHLICLLSCCKQAVLATGHEVNISEGGLEDVQESRVATLADYHEIGIAAEFLSTLRVCAHVCSMCLSVAVLASAEPMGT